MRGKNIVDDELKRGLGLSMTELEHTNSILAFLLPTSGMATRSKYKPHWVLSRSW